MDWELLAFVKMSEQRQNVLKALTEPKIPSELAKSLKMDLSHVSRALLQLEEKKLVKCLNPDTRKGRFYQRTEKATQILAQLK